MSNYKKILCVADYFAPGFLGGGPITTLVNMRKQLKDQLKISIYTRDRDLGSSVAYPNIEVNHWLDTLDGPIYYASPNKFNANTLIKILRNKKYDLIYLNSFFSLHGSVFILLGLRLIRCRIPVLIAPRGEFSSGALSIKSFKKNFFICFARFVGLYRDVYWHASSKYEESDILQLFPKASDRIFIAADPVIANLSETGNLLTSKKEKGRVNIVFISRITRMKNLDFLIKILSKVCAQVQLNIYGPVEDEIYWEECKRLIKNLPENINVIVHGPIAADLVLSTFEKYDLFVFPTLGENFGHVIFESLQARTPVIVSDKTPWISDGSGAVNVIPLQNLTKWREAIEKIADLSTEGHEVLRCQSFNYAKKYADSAKNHESNLNLFLNVISLD